MLEIMIGIKQLDLNSKNNLNTTWAKADGEHNVSITQKQTQPKVLYSYKVTNSKFVDQSNYSL